MKFYTRNLLADEIAAHGWQIGEYTYGTPIVQTWGVDGRLFIGRYCSIAGGVKIFLGGNHRSDFVTTYPFNAIRPAAGHIVGHPSTKGDVRIGNDVWLAQDCVIYSGVTIGDGAIVGGNAIVSRDVPPYAMVAGNPANIIKYRFSETQIAELLKYCWWDWHSNEIELCYDLLQSTDISGFIEYCRNRKQST